MDEGTGTLAAAFRHDPGARRAAVSARGPVPGPPRPVPGPGTHPAPQPTAGPAPGPASDPATDPPTDPPTDPAGFTAAVRPELPVLLRVAGTLTGSAADAEDLVQDALLRAWRGWDRFDGRHLRAWLLTIVRNAAVNATRRRRPGVYGATGDLPAGARPAFGAASAADPEQLLLDGVLDPALADALRALDPRFRTVLLLVDVAGLAHAETAAVLGVPVGTVVSRLSRARTRVRDRLRATGPHGGRLGRWRR